MLDDDDFPSYSPATAQQQRGDILWVDWIWDGWQVLLPIQPDPPPEDEQQQQQHSHHNNNATTNGERSSSASSSAKAPWHVYASVQ